MNQAKWRGWTGVWEEASTKGKQSRSGGIATLVRAPVPIFRTNVGKEGRWHRVTIPWIKGVAIHVVNVYGWVSTGIDSSAKNDALALEIREDLGGLGRVPWVAGGDWNRTPEQTGSLWSGVGSIYVKKRGHPTGW